MNWIKSFWKGLTEKSGTPRVTVQRRSIPVPPAAVDPQFNNFTPRAMRVLSLARDEAVRLCHNFIGTEHVLLGLIALGDGTAVNVLKKVGVNLEAARAEVERYVGMGPDAIPAENVPYTPRVKKTLALAAKQARALRHTYIGTEHILLGLLAEGDGVAARILINLGLNLDQTRELILNELDPTRTSASAPAPATGVDKPKTAPVTAGSLPPKSDRQPHYVLQHPAGEPVDTTRRYDIYCADSVRGTVVYRNARFNSMKQLFPRSQYDGWSGFVELELNDGQTVFVSRSSINRFCAPGTTPGAEGAPGQKF